MSGPQSTLGQAIRLARLERGLSQDEVAERAQITRSYLSEVERGANVSIDVLDRLVAALKISALPIGGRSVNLIPESDLRARVNVPRITRLMRESREAAERLTNAWEEEVSGASTGSTEEPRQPRFSVVRDEPMIVSDLPMAPDTRKIRITLDEQNLLDELREAFRNSPDAEYRTPFRGKKKYVVPRGIDVAAGHGAELLEPDEEALREIPEHYYELGARKVLRARGNSLIGRGIVDRDLLFIKPTSEPLSDRIIVCRLNEHAFVKIFQRIDDERAELMSANPDFGPIPIGPGDSFHCFGVVVGRSGYALQQTEEVK